MRSETPGAPHSRGLHRFALLTAAATFLLLIAGALVTSNDAGLAVPDWPLSFGTWMPPLVGNILYEHGHRLVATFVGLLTIILTVWLWRSEPRRWVRRLGLGALAAVILQGLLGGLTVLFLLPRPVSIAHASLAQIFFCLTVSLAVITSRDWKEPTPRVADPGTPSLRGLSGATTLALFGQLVLGASYRHSLLSLLPHVVGAAVVAYLVMWTAKRVSSLQGRPAPLWRPAVSLAALVAVQLLLGPAAYLSRLAALEAPQPTLPLVALTVAHVAVGGLALAASVVLTLQCHRRFFRREEAPRLAAEKAPA